MQQGNTRLAGAREEARLRVSRVKRWVMGLALALTGFLSALAAHALPASHANPPAASGTATEPAPVPREDAAPDDRQPVPDISPPAAPPAPSASSGEAVSGGS